ncbi:MAG TPA: YdhR family protein [Blastocatellia bacterium]|nr:YdhR family protein [Blastocatellia bacterium]
MAVIQFVKFRSGLPDEEVRRLMEARAPQFRAVPGLIQKYYFRDGQTGEHGGIYVWDSHESMREFRQSEFARGMGDAYKVEGDKRIEILDVELTLREE